MDFESCVKSIGKWSIHQVSKNLISASYTFLQDIQWFTCLAKLSSLPTKTDNYNTRPQVMRLQYIHKNVSKNLRYIKTNIGLCNVPDKDTDIVGEGSLWQ